MVLGRRKWGNKGKVLKLLFERVIGMMGLYGAEIWGERVRDSRVTIQLNAIPEGYHGRYATAPTAALSVVTGCVPLGVRAKVMYEGGKTWGENETGKCDLEG